MHTVISQMYFYLSLTILLCPIQPRPATSLALATLILVGSEPTVAHDAASRGLAGSPRPADSRKLQKSKKKEDEPKKVMYSIFVKINIQQPFSTRVTSNFNLFLEPLFLYWFYCHDCTPQISHFCKLLTQLLMPLSIPRWPSYAVMQTYAVNPP